MSSPFPGMDPYFEDNKIWSGFHHFLADELAAQLNPLIGPKYYADVEVRTVGNDINLTARHTTYPDTGVFRPTLPERQPMSGSGMALATISDAPVQRAVLIGGYTKMRSVRVYVAGTDRLVTSIEILSPFNKRRGEGIETYRRKRERLLQSPVHLVELDLLRGGTRPGYEVIEPPLDTDYILLVNRSQDDERRISEIWPVGLNEALPSLPIPLLSPDPDAVVDLGLALQNIYTRAGYDWRINYQNPVPPPALRSKMAEWLSENLPKIGTLK
ncbi:MAG TPA: DUF4058 family protein [Chloroflexi bacterium]|nr:DUF4058 family protein [Chloroflexota bacterium]